MNFVLDMNIPKGWVEFLQASGHKVIHWRDIGNIRAEDSEIMEWAIVNETIGIIFKELEQGALVIIDPKRHRVRVLSLGK